MSTGKSVGPLTIDLLALSDWLAAWLATGGVTQIAMESTGVDRSRPESTGVDRSRPESTGVDRSRPEWTGVDWRPVFKLLEDESRALVLVNPQHLKAVPGRKTDVKDDVKDDVKEREWLADLLRHGLIAPSFIPPAPIREFRE
jgi:hypothetical protein